MTLKGDKNMDDFKKLNNKDNSHKYNLDEFDNDIIMPVRRDVSENDNVAVPDYGDNFNFQTDEDDNGYSYNLHDDNYEKDYSNTAAKSKHKKNKRSQNTAIIFIVAAIICLIAAIIFVLTQCTGNNEIETPAATTYVKATTVPNQTVPHTDSQYYEQNPETLPEPPSDPESNTSASDLTQNETSQISTDSQPTDIPDSTDPLPDISEEGGDIEQPIEDPDEESDKENDVIVIDGDE